ncbi:MAG: DNA polymerase III subunit gamma/tau [Devosia nanyangense]|uniref:DNA polymerase III subunit gamma/tau n=1 Tax=Devosia nanyangense TaxID=1228055 RepID=A0A933NXM1_9HYPH|nr:DNA polymerase III subunit gamma/tau [Devosia nanyangense]
MTPPVTGASAPYLVLARKYRPSSFSTLIGQDAMVQTLRNAFKAKRIPHAFMLTGIRGVGKTTTARILARAVNFEDESGRRPTLELDQEGIHDRAIIEGRHVDVIEMDAASNTGIGDIREIIDSVKYAPASAPYKVYIIDEVHMLSTAAFNGLLKTLEEPPPYVKFIFATTEIRKVPVTILSRCMRFDLRRVPPETMTAHLVDLLSQEAIGYEPEALAMIVRAGEGSVRDCQSLLDQAISHGDGKVTAATVKAMLGLGDRAKAIDLFEALMKGEIATALTLLRELYDAGADPETVIGDLADFTNLVTRMKIVPAAADDISLTPDERSCGPELAAKLGMRALSRAWQILFKGFDEVKSAGNGLQAAEMVLVRLAYASELPSPDELIAKLQNAPAQQPGGAQALPHRGTIGGGPQAMRQPDPARRYEAAPTPAPQGFANPRSYLELVTLAGEKRDLLLKTALETQMRPVAFREKSIEVALVEGADPAIIQMLSARLKLWTGQVWGVSVSTRPAEGPTLRDVKDERIAQAKSEAVEDPLVKAILEMFPGSKVTVKLREEQVPDAAYEDAFSEEREDE